MAFVTHDLACSSGHLMDSVLYERGSGTPNCPHCESPTHISWHSGQSPGLQGFGNVLYDGQKMTTTELENKRREVQRKNPGKQVAILPNGDLERSRRRADRAHRAYLHRKNSGIDVAANRAQRTASLTEKLRTAQKSGNLDSIDKASNHLNRYRKSLEKSA